MPCFHTHWLVALEAISDTPDYITNGRAAYVTNTATYRKACREAIRNLGVQSKTAKPDLPTSFATAKANWEGAIASKDTALDGAITCFSAYMLGACGPDFWTLPSQPISKRFKVPSMAPIHFDLGHYNRTHRQFELSIEDVGGPSKTDIKSRVQRSYFLGMATHVAADLVIHQLVNVVAGAYNLLEKRHLLQDKVWENEHGGAMGLNIWNTHNKVEHFWDSYIRYRYLGDYGPFWPAEAEQTQGAPSNLTPFDDHNWVSPLGFPTLEGLEAAAERHGVRDRCIEYLRAESTRLAVEKPLMFPWVFCDRILAKRKNDIEPFIYRIVVDKEKGAYREAALSGAFADKAVDEADSPQMKDASENRGEWHKLEHFSSANNLLVDNPTNFNFLTFKVCPDVERTRTFARNVFYDYSALQPFLHTAVNAARKFLGELSRAYDSGDVDALIKLRGFWNLDTGLGLKVRQVSSDTNRESITELDFVHVFEQLHTGAPGYKRREPYLAPWREGSVLGELSAVFGGEEPVHKIRKNHTTYEFSEAQVFKTYAHAAPFDDIQSVYEKHADQFLERIPVAHDSRVAAKGHVVPTATLTEENVLEMRMIRNRLTLCCRASIADLKSPNANHKDAHCEDLALFFLGDNAGKPGEPATGETSEWLAAKSQVLDYRTKPVAMNWGVQTFATRILVNSERETADDAAAAKREIAKGVWNNLVSYSDHQGHYGRNFAISTGRKHVLVSTEGGTFGPYSKLAYYKNISPTEHVFFTLYPLVREGGDYWDIFSKEDVPRGQLADLKKISGCGTVKIVLIYERTCDKSLNLREAYIDGLKVPVRT